MGKGRRMVGIGAAFVGLAAVLVSLLLHQGRPWWCPCNQLFPWVGDVNSEHVSRHVLDAYSFTHVLHGVIFCGLTWLVGRRWRTVWRLWAALLVEAGWEWFENTPFIIARYRTFTVDAAYAGDSIANSLGDLACCAIGFWLALRMGWRWALAFFFAVELLLLLAVRDNLTLNVLMLVYPIEAIKRWQMAR